MNCRYLSRVLKDRGLRSVRTEIPVRRSDLWLIFLLVFQTRVAIALPWDIGSGVKHAYGKLTSSTESHMHEFVRRRSSHLHTPESAYHLHEPPCVLSSNAA